MNLLIDDANAAKIQEIMEIYPIDGVTTNPSILARCGSDMFGMLHEVREVLGNERELHIQVIATDCEGMLRDAAAIVKEIPGRTFIKVPVTVEGLKAIRLLKKEGYRVTATTVLSRMQALLASKAGADYIAPYLNRMDALGMDGVEEIRQMQYNNIINGLSTQILAASFKTHRQVASLFPLGIGGMTIPSDLFDTMLDNPHAATAVEAFTRAFESRCGEGSTMAGIRNR